VLNIIENRIVKGNFNARGISPPKITNELAADKNILSISSMPKFITILTDSRLTICSHFQPILELSRISSRIQKTPRL